MHLCCYDFQGGVVCQSGHTTRLPAMARSAASVHIACVPLNTPACSHAIHHHFIALQLAPLAYAHMLPQGWMLANHMPAGAPMSTAAAVGLGIWLLGWLNVVRADNILRGLRKPGETGG